MIKLLRSFVPEQVEFGTNEALNDGQWVDNGVVVYTCFQTDDQYVLVLLGPSLVYEGTELAFITALKSKATSIVDVFNFGSDQPDPDMKPDANRGTHMFRKVVHVALEKAVEHPEIMFQGATVYLDRIYTRLDRLGYFTALAAERGYTVTREGRNLYLRRG